MFSKIFLNKQNLLGNVRTLENIAGKKLCVMVKAQAYGHGEAEIVKILQEEVDFFGVSSQAEAISFKEICDKNVIVFGRCEDYKICMEKGIAFALFSLEHAKSIIKIAKQENLMPRFHLCVNSGMNRYGEKSKKDFVKLIKLLQKNNLSLEGIYTHFSSLTSDEEYTKKQKQIFEDFCMELPKQWNTIRHVGGGQSVFKDIEADMYRVGMECYGYGNELVMPVMRVESQIVDIQNVAKGEHVGYLCSYTAKQDMKVATIPLGYGDGLPRKLSNKFSVIIKGKEAKSTGNICMDAFMVDVTSINCKVGDKVLIMDNASTFAPIIGTTEYEVLTAFSKFRGERIIEE